MTIHELECNDWGTSRDIILKNREKLQNALANYLNGILENLNECTDYDIYKILEMCEFTVSTMSISQIWRPKNEELL